MYHLKTIAFLVIWAHWALAAPESSVEEPATWPSLEQAIVYNNVDDIYLTAEKNHVLPSIPVAASITIKDPEIYPKERSADCSANKAGLGRLLREAKSLLPLDKIQQLIVDSVANDEEVYALVVLQRSEPVRQLIATIKKSLEYGLMHEYACEQLQLNLSEMWNFVKSFISLTKEQVKPSEGEFKGRAGIRGLLLDIHDALPRQMLRDLFQKLMEEDLQLNAAVQRLQSSEFRHLLRNLRLLPEAVELREQLMNVGVPLIELKELINEALGWAGDEFGDNGADWKI